MWAFARSKHFVVQTFCAHWIWACGSRSFFFMFFLAPTQYDITTTTIIELWNTNIRKQTKENKNVFGSQSRTNHPNKHWSFFFFFLICQLKQHIYLFIYLLLFIVSTAGHVMKNDILKFYHIKKGGEKVVCARALICDHLYVIMVNDKMVRRRRSSEKCSRRQNSRLIDRKHTS